MTGPSPSWLVACDLDQTLIFSRPSFRLPSHGPAPELTLVETIDGSPTTYMTASGVSALGRLAATVPVVPVTTRTNAQYGRVDLGIRPRFAVTANGGHLIVDGAEDEAWNASVLARIAATARPLAEMVARAERLAADGWVRLVRVADGLFVYLVAYERSGIPDLSGVAADLAGDGWTLSVQGRKVYLVPAALTKEAALAEVARRAGTTRLAAAGDSLLDRSMLDLADVAVRPAHGELHELGWTAPHLRVTAASGILAAEEIIAVMAGTVRAPGAPGARRSAVPAGDAAGAG